jgi:hypothetical protein
MTERATIGIHSRLVASEHVHARRFEDDIVMIDLHGGEYYALDAVGARMWELLTTGRSPNEVATLLLAEYDVHRDQVLRDCMQLVDELVSRNLLVVRQP